MPIGLKTLRITLCSASLALGLAALPAQAQLGTSSNPPPQRLFNFNDAPKPDNTGLGTMAERRRALAKHPAVRRRTVHHTSP